MRIKSCLLAFFLVISMGACSSPPSQASGNGTVLLIVGDSLSAGYQIDNPEENGWVGLMEKQMREDGFLHQGQHIVNASISGETTSGGLARLDDLLRQHQPSHVLIELGANDMMRRQSMAELQKNLVSMIGKSEQAGAKVGILSVELPTIASLGGGGGLGTAYEAVTEQTQVQEIRYPLASIFNKSGMMLPDRIHPSQQAQPVLAEKIGPEIRRFIGQ